MSWQGLHGLHAMQACQWAQSWTSKLQRRAAAMSSSSRCVAAPCDALLCIVCPADGAAVHSQAAEQRACVQAALAKQAFDAVCHEYDRIEAAMQDPYMGAGEGFEQRWLV